LIYIDWKRENNAIKRKKTILFSFYFMYFLIWFK